MEGLKSKKKNIKGGESPQGREINSLSGDMFKYVWKQE